MKKQIIFGSLFALSTTELMASNAENFAKNDPIGWMMAIIAMSVVFSSLVVLFLCFKYLYPLCTYLGLQIKKSFHRKKQYEQITDRRKEKKNIKVTETETGKEVVDEELAAAIGMALFLHEDGMHDQESGILTLVNNNSTWTGAGQNQKRSPLRRF